MNSSLRFALALSLIVAGACNGRNPGGPGGPATPAVWLGNVVAITSTDEIVTFFEESPQSFVSRVDISGLDVGEHVLGIDFRTTDNSVMGWTSTGRIVDLDPQTGIATERGTLSLGASVGTLACAAFNPVTAELRAATTAEENVRMSSDTGAFVATETPFVYPVADVSFGITPDLVALAHNNAFERVERCTLFAIDDATNALVRINASDAPEAGNDGELVTEGMLSITPTGPIGFSIGGFDRAFITCTTAGNPVQLYRLALDGTATLVGAIDATADVIDIAVRSELAPVILAVTSTNRLVEARSTYPTELLSDTPITGMQTGEEIVALTVLPSTGEVIALGDTSRLYTLDPETGVATPMAGSAFAPALSGARFGIASDFNLTTPGACVVSDTQQNLSIDFATPSTATTENSWVYAIGDPEFGSAPKLVSCAFWGSSPTNLSLWGLDSDTDSFVRLSVAASTPTPDDGVVTTAFGLGLDFDDESVLLPVDSAHMLTAFRPAGTTGTKVTRVNTVTTDVHILGETTTGFRAAVVRPPTESAVIGLTATGDLVRFQAHNAADILATVSITGLAIGETLVGIDYRPANNRLYGLGDAGRLYRIDAATGAATLVNPMGVALSGARFCIDFDPRADDLRVISDTGQNLRIDPANGALIATDTSLAFDLSDPETGTVPRVIGLAYANNGTEAECSAAFAIDQASEGVVNVGSRDGCTISAASGTLFTIASLGVVEADAHMGLDVDATGRCIATYTSSTQPLTVIGVLPLSGGASATMSFCEVALIDIAIVR